VLTLGRRSVRLYPIFHPAAALYTPRMLETLREDFARLPELLAEGAPEQPPAEIEVAEVPPPPPADASADPAIATDAVAAQERAGTEVDQLGLF
jgi:DNA polymerase